MYHVRLCDYWPINTTGLDFPITSMHQSLLSLYIYIDLYIIFMSTFDKKIYDLPLLRHSILFVG